MMARWNIFKLQSRVSLSGFIKLNNVGFYIIQFRQLARSQEYRIILWKIIHEISVTWIVTKYGYILNFKLTK